jgi:FMN reductase (NADPH)/FMN reductase [NAD(P)H]
MHQTRHQRAGRAVEDIRADIGQFCKRKYMSDFSLEMNRSAAEYLKKFD